MSELQLTEHLEELRKRIVVCIVSLVLTTTISLPLVPILINRIQSDLFKEVPFVFLSPQEAVLVYMKISFLFGFILSFPVLAYEFWAFMAPGLIRKEKKLLLNILFPSIFLFISGVVFAYCLLLPVTLNFLIDISNSVAEPLFSVSQTLSFILTLIVSFGLIFQLPLAIGIFTRVGILNSKILESKRKYVILAAFIFSAVITDPSVITQLLMACSIISLYEVGILASKVIKRNDRKS